MGQNDWLQLNAGSVTVLSSKHIHFALINAKLTPTNKQHNTTQHNKKNPDSIFLAEAKKYHETQFANHLTNVGVKEENIRTLHDGI
jgi:hypothetical protein